MGRYTLGLLHESIGTLGEKEVVVRPALGNIAFLLRADKAERKCRIRVQRSKNGQRVAKGSSEAGDPIAVRERSRIPAKMRGVCVWERAWRARAVCRARRTRAAVAVAYHHGLTADADAGLLPAPPPT